MHGHYQRPGAPAGRRAISLVPTEAPQRRDQAQRLPCSGTLHPARQGLAGNGASFRGRPRAHGQPLGERGHGSAQRGLRDDRADRHRSREPGYPDGSRRREKAGRPRGNCWFIAVYDSRFIFVLLRLLHGRDNS